MGGAMDVVNDYPLHIIDCTKPSSLSAIPFGDGHLLLYTLSHVEPSGNAPVRPGYNELTLQLATAACYVRRPSRKSLLKTGASDCKTTESCTCMSGMYLRMCRKPCYA
jgi:hypothetical protein